jgi:hypothetical protein
MGKGTENSAGTNSKRLKILRPKLRRSKRQTATKQNFGLAAQSPGSCAGNTGAFGFRHSFKTVRYPFLPLKVINNFFLLA